MREIHFIVEEAPEGGYSARAVGEAIFTEADDLQSLHEQLRDAVGCHFDHDKQPITLKTWDSAAYLKTEQDRVLFLDACLEESDPALIAHALGMIANARGMDQLARDVGMSRESLCQALSGEGNPEFATVMKVIKALGFRLHATSVA